MQKVWILALALFSASARADLFDINASERGWVCSGCSGGTDGAAPGNNYFAGLENLVSIGLPISKYRDWFEFSIPTLAGGSLVSATLNLA